jgi:hypothetical protein
VTEGISEQIELERIYRAETFWKCVLAMGGLSGERTNEKDKLPALFLGQALLEGGHRLSAFADLIKNLAVGNAVHVLRIGEAGRSRVIAGGFGTIAFAGFAVALDAFIEIDGVSGGESGGRKLNGILSQLRLFRDFPGTILGNGVINREAQKGENEHE